MNPRTWRVRLGVVTAAALVIRVGYAVAAWGDEKPPGDGFYFATQATELRHGLGFIDPLLYELLGEKLQAAHHPPLYQVVLALGSFVTGESYLGLRVASCVLGTLGVVFVALLARRVAGGPGEGDRVALIAGTIAAVYPALWVNDALLLSESLYTPLIAGSLLATYCLWDDPGPRRAVVLGLVVGLATITRAEGLMLFVVLVIPVILLMRWLDVRDRLVLVAISGVVAGLVAAPWVMYNLTRFEEPVTLSYGVGGVLPQANCDETYSGELLGYWSAECLFPGPGDGIAPEGNFCRIHPIRCSRLYLDRFPDESVGATYGRDLGLDYISAHKGRVPVVVAARVGRIWEVYRPAQNVELNTVVEHRGVWGSRIGLIMFYELLAASVFGAILLRRRGRPIWPLLSMAVLVTVTAALAIPVTRYRVPVEVALCVLGAVALDELWSRRHRLTRTSARAPNPKRRAPARADA